MVQAITVTVLRLTWQKIKALALTAAAVHQKVAAVVLNAGFNFLQNDFFVEPAPSGFFYAIRFGLYWNNRDSR